MRKIFLLLALLSTILASGQTQWLNPLPSGRTVKQVAFAGPGEVFLINDYGELFTRTQPGGAWTLVQRFPGAFAMDFRGATGVVAGWGDAVYSTRDAGRTWTRAFMNTRVLSSADCYFTNVQVLPGDTIIAVDQNNSTLYRSNDGGRTWSDSVQNSVFNGALQVVFVDARMGFRTGYDGVQRTADGGRNWTFLNTGTGIDERFVRFYDRQQGLLYQRYSILRTADGGNTWNSIDFPARVLCFAYDGPDTVYASVLGGQLYRSLDRGATWNAINSPSSPQLSTLAFQQGIAVGGGYNGSLYHSGDGGAHWDAYGTFYRTVDGLQLKGDRAYLVTAPLLYRSDDRGLSWRAMPTPPPGLLGNGLSRVWFRSPDTGIVFTRSQTLVFKTTDGGATWVRLPGAADGYDAFSDFDIIDNRTAFANLGTYWQGRVLRSTDGGDSWEQMGTVPGASHIDFVDGRTGFALAGSNILRSNDSGRTWQQLYTDPASGISINGIHFVNTTTGYLFGNNGLLKKTTDGGATWTRQPAPSDHLLRLYFFNDQYGYLEGEYGGVYRTFDGGATWHPEPGLTRSLFDPLFTPDSLLYAGGYAGALQRSSVKDILQDSLIATERTGCSARLSSWVSAAFCTVDDISFEYGTTGFYNSVAGTASSVTNGSVRSSVLLSNLEQGTQYRVRVRMLSGGTVRYSPHITFRTQTLVAPVIFASNDTLFNYYYYSGNQWYRNGVLIPGATANFFVPTEPGRYTVQAVVDGCRTPLSAEQEARGRNSGERVHLYPNPAHDWVNVVLQQASAQNYELRGVGGVVLRSGILHPGLNRIPLNGIAPGIYLLVVSDSNGGRPTVRKIVCR